MKVQLIYRVILPLLQRKGVALIGISTLDGGADNFWTQMIHRTYPDGTPVFNTYVWESSCKACQTAGQAEKCTHESARLPFWLSSVNGDVLRALYGGDNETFLRETRNISEDTNGSRFFEKELIEWLADPSKVFQRLGGDASDHFFVTIDPAAGGVKSESVCQIWFQPSPGKLMVSFFIQSKKMRTSLMNLDSDVAVFWAVHHSMPALAKRSSASLVRGSLGRMSPAYHSEILALNWSHMARWFPWVSIARMMHAMVCAGKSADSSRIISTAETGSGLFGTRRTNASTVAWSMRSAQSSSNRPSSLSLSSLQNHETQSISGPLFVFLIFILIFYTHADEFFS